MKSQNKPQKRLKKKQPDKNHPDLGHATTQSYRQTFRPAGENYHDEPHTTVNKPITNQDEQRKTTNAGNSDEPMGEQETEGERRRNRSMPRLHPTTEYGLAERTNPVMEDYAAGR